MSLQSHVNNNYDVCQRAISTSKNTLYRQRYFFFNIHYNSHYQTKLYIFLLHENICNCFTLLNKYKTILFFGWKYNAVKYSTREFLIKFFSIHIVFMFVMSCILLWKLNITTHILHMWCSKWKYGRIFLCVWCNP